MKKRKKEIQIKLFNYYFFFYPYFFQIEQIFGYFWCFDTMFQLLFSPVCIKYIYINHEKKNIFFLTKKLAI